MLHYLVNVETLKVHINTNSAFNVVYKVGVKWVKRHTVHVVNSLKRCKIELLLSQTTNYRKRYIAYWIAAFRWPWITFVSITYCKPLQIRGGFFVKLCRCWQDFNSYIASRGPSCIPQPLVRYGSAVRLLEEQVTGSLVFGFIWVFIQTGLVDGIVLQNNRCPVFRTRDSRNGYVVRRCWARFQTTANRWLTATTTSRRSRSLSWSCSGQLFSAQWLLTYARFSSAKYERKGKERSVFI